MQKLLITDRQVNLRNWVNSPMWILWEIGPCSLLTCFNLLQGTTVLSSSPSQSPSQYRRMGWSSMAEDLGTEVFRSEKSHGLSGFEIRLSTVCSDYILLLLHACQIYLQVGLPRDVGRHQGMWEGRRGLFFFFCKTLLKLGKMFRNITYVHSYRRKVGYVNVENYVSCSCHRWNIRERTTGSWRQLPGHSWEQVGLVQGTRPFLCILLHLTLSSSQAATALVQQQSPC